MSKIQAEMPVLARHEGEWVGTYTLIDAKANILDHHQAHLSCQFPQDGSHDYYQINRYTWENGKQEEYEFPGFYRDKRLWFDTERIQGQAWEADDAIVILHFSYKTIPDFYVYEMIQISPCNRYRARTWHWFKEHQLFQRTLIQEERQR
jgi:hypothetical protein